MSAREPIGPRPSNINNGKHSNSGHRRMVVSKDVKIKNANVDHVYVKGVNDDNENTTGRRENIANDTTEEIDLEEREIYMKEALKQSEVVESMKRFKEFIMKDNANARLPRFIVEIEKELAAAAAAAAAAATALEQHEEIQHHSHQQC